MKAFIFVLLAVLALSTQTKAQAPSCSECELVVGVVEGWVETNTSLTDIQNYLDALCSTIFAPYKDSCEAIANEGLEQIVAWLQANETPEEVCTQLTLCTSSKAVKLSQSLECSECDSVVSVIEEWLDNTNNQAEVITTIETVCTYMPGWEATCDSMIETGVPEVVNWIDTNENVTVVCGQLGMCGNVNASRKASQKSAMIKAAKTEDLCSTCTTLVGFAEEWALSNYTATEIENYLEYICQFIPDYQQQCDQIIVAEVPQILASLEQDESPQQVCTQLELCTSSKAKAHHVNVNGPSKHKPAHQTHKANVH